jgi:hypothetical protein
MPLLSGVIASQISGRLWSPQGAYESIASATVPSGGVASITFGSVPQGYAHLELRVSAQATLGSGAGAGQYFMNFNNDTGGNYTRHDLTGDGSTATGFGSATGTFNYASIQRGYYTSSASNVFSAHVVSILDYASTSKTTTVRNFGGYDANGSGEIYFSSSMWTSTAAVSSITLSPIAGNLFREFSQFALYGIKG